MELLSTRHTVTEVAFNCGFSDPVQFNRLFTAKTGMTPSQYRDKQRDSEPTDSYVIIE